MRPDCRSEPRFDGLHRHPVVAAHPESQGLELAPDDRASHGRRVASGQPGDATVVRRRRPYVFGGTDIACKVYFVYGLYKKWPMLLPVSRFPRYLRQQLEREDAATVDRGSCARAATGGVGCSGSDCGRRRTASSRHPCRVEGHVRGDPWHRFAAGVTGVGAARVEETQSVAEGRVA